MASQNDEVDERLSYITSGKHALIVGSGNKGTVLKITRCPETIELLRRLQNRPVAGLPEVLHEIYSEDVSVYSKDKFKGRDTACFELVKYHKISQSFDELELVNKFLKKYIEEPSVDNNPVKILKAGSLQLKNEGYHRFSNAIEYLIDFLEDRPKAFLDNCFANFMIDAQQNLIYVDPISHK